MNWTEEIKNPKSKEEIEKLSSQRYLKFGVFSVIYWIITICLSVYFPSIRMRYLSAQY